MNDQQINEAIAEACGWKMYCDEAKEWKSKDDWVIDPDGFMKLRCDIPFYTTDLNAMHEAEKMLSIDTHNKYTLELLRLTYKEGTLHEGMPIGALNAATAYFLLRATAHQRAVAFVHTIGKWIRHEPATKTMG